MKAGTPLTFVGAILALVVSASSLFAQNEPEGLFAVVKEIAGPADDVDIRLPNGDMPDIVVGARYTEKTKINTGSSSTVLISLEGKVGTTIVRNSLLSINQNSKFMLDRFILEDNSVVTRIALEVGEVKVKVTEEHKHITTDMKVATPNATASITGTEGNVGFNANKGTTASCSSGGFSSARGNGTTRNVGAGTQLNDGDDSALDNAVSGSSTVIVPIGMVAFEVKVGQLTVGGPERPASDLNNAATNPNANRGSGESGGSGDSSGHDSGETLPARRRR